MAEYTKEQLWELYEQLPEDLQEAVFSEDVGKKVQGICYDNNIIDNKVFTNILKNVGYVFLGISTPSDFREFLEGELEPEKAEDVYVRINNEVFAELRESLEALYGIKITFEKSVNKKKKSKPKEQDKYLEPIE